MILAYAQRHPTRVRGIVVVGVTMTRAQEIGWLYHGLRLLLPVEWKRIRAGVPRRSPGRQPLMNDADAAVRDKAAGDWCAWEIHGRRDLSCPLPNAWELAQAWPDAELKIIEDSGHTGSPTLTPPSSRPSRGSPMTRHRGVLIEVPRHVITPDSMQVGSMSSVRI